MSARDKKLLYHLTPLANVPSIAEHGLLSRADLRRRALEHADVADPQIVRRRAAVRALVERELADLPDVRVDLHEPASHLAPRA